MINNIISNSAFVNYNFNVDPNIDDIETETVSTSIVNATISYADLLTTGNFINNVDREYASKGDKLTYTIVAKNTGNATATNVILTDSLPLNARYVENSLMVNGESYIGDPSKGINLTSIPPNSTTFLTFNALIESEPVENPIKNNASIEYNYTIDPSIPNGGIGKNITDTVSTTITYADLFSDGNFIKTASTTKIGISELLSYSFIIRNTGNTTACNVVIFDTIPCEATYIPESILVNGSYADGDPYTGIKVPDIGPNNSAQVSFKVTVDTVSNVNPLVNRGYIGYQFTQNPDYPLGASGSTLSNAATTAILPNIMLESFSNPQFVIAGNTVVYTIVVSNPNNIALNNLTVSDMLAPGLSFIKESMILNSIPSPNSNIITGIKINSLASNSVSTIQFQAKVSDNCEGAIENSSKVLYYYSGTNNIQLIGQQQSNLNIVNVSVVSVTITNTTSLTTVSIGQMIPYSVVIKNTGDVDLCDVVFRDILSNNLNFVTSSFQVNGVAIDIDPITLQRGVNIGSIPVGAISTVTFDAFIKGGIPGASSYKIGNSAYAIYTYELGDGSGGSKYTEIATTTITKV